MAATRHAGTVEWRREWSKPGLRVLFTSSDLIGDAFIEGAFWNDEATAVTINPQRFPLKDISGRATSLGLKTLTNFTGQINTESYVDVHNYPDNIWNKAYFTSGTAEIEIRGIPKDHIVDLVMGASNNQANSRGGNVTITPDGRSAEVVVGNTGITGPVMFAGIEPVNGRIKILFDVVTEFNYFSFFDLRAYRR